MCVFVCVFVCVCIHAYVVILGVRISFCRVNSTAHALHMDITQRAG